MNAGIWVIKLGGQALGAPGASAAFGAALARQATPVLIVHGGGGEISAWCERIGAPQRFVNGLRVTDADTLQVTAAVLAGLANKRLVAELRAAGVDAVGLSALDGGTLRVVPHRDAASLGFVGEIAGADPSLALALLEAGRTPVFASLGAHGAQLLNVNADDVAAALATAVGAACLVLLSDAPGVVIGGAVLPRVESGSLDELIESPEVTGGMLPKLAAARAALEGGVRTVQIAAWQGDDTLDRLLGEAPIGTRIEAREVSADV